jgi:hypothetical protein
MLGGWLAVSALRLTIAGGALLLVAGASACGQTKSLDTEVRDRLRDTPADKTEVRRIGKVETVHCFSTGLVYRGANVYSCEARHSSGTLTEICVAKVDGNLVTRDEDRRMPCPP